MDCSLNQHKKARVQVLAVRTPHCSVAGLSVHHRMTNHNRKNAQRG